MTDKLNATQLMLRSLSLSIVLVIGIWACQDSPPPQPNRFRLIKTQRIYDFLDLDPARFDTTTFTYQYDDAGKLINATNTFVSVHLSSYISTFRYNDLNQLVEVKSLRDKDTFPSYPDASPGTIITYEYDKPGNITAINVYTIQSTGYRFLKEEYKLAYNEGKKPASLSWKFNYGSQFDPYRYEDYVFTYENDNITSMAITANPVRSNGYKSSTYTRALRYDNKINPFYQLTGVPLFSYDYIANLSKNNLLVNDEVYSYDSNNLLVKSTSTNGKTTTTYFYESY